MFIFSILRQSDTLQVFKWILYDSNISYVLLSIYHPNPWIVPKVQKEKSQFSGECLTQKFIHEQFN